MLISKSGGEPQFGSQTYRLWPIFQPLELGKNYLNDWHKDCSFLLYEP
jgi:hypothetical protein